MTRTLLDSSLCPNLKPTQDNRECAYYEYAENDKMNIDSGKCGFCKRPNAYRCIADVTRIIPQSHSSIGTFLTCHQLYYLQKILGIEKRPAFLSTAMKAGVLWDSVKQKHLGAEINIKSIIDTYEIDPITVVKVKALYNAYKELEMQVEPGYELQSKINLTYDIVIPPSSFIPSVTVGAEAINLWQEKEVQSNDERTWKFPLTVNGFYDRKYPTYFTEDKLSSRPEFYLDPFYIQSQCSTYFLADPKLEWVIMEVVQFPKYKSPKNKEESADVVYKKVYDDILSHPSNYFMGFKRDKRVYGRKLFRNEFDLVATQERFKQVTIEILAARWSNNFYKNFKSCSNVMPGIGCELQSICRNGNMSETTYQIRDKK